MARARVEFILAVALWMAASAGHAGIALPLSQPSWMELTADQKRILAPLSGEWDRMEVFRRKKWVGIAQRYPSLTPDEQARMQRRMTDWARLTPDERKLARDKFKSLQKVPPEKKEAVRAKWQEYKELPDSEKERFKVEAVRGRTPPQGPALTDVGVRPAPKPKSASLAEQGSAR